MAILYPRVILDSQGNRWEWNGAFGAYRTESVSVAYGFDRIESGFGIVATAG